MKVKTINPVLLIALFLTSCVPATAIVSSTETPVPLPTLSPVPATASPSSPLISEQPSPTGAAAAPLDAQGPWLLYVHNSPRPGMYDVPDVDPEFILLNQDGSGLTPITLESDVDHFLMGGPNVTNYLAAYDDRLYLFRPSDATGVVICGTLGYFPCESFYTGDEKGGLLASVYRAVDDPDLELRIYELPGGRIHDHFPLVKCTKDVKTCEEVRTLWGEMGGARQRWSPNGRYLAFAANLDATSSDLFVYDSQGGGLRRLTQGPDWVGPIEWSPDGTQIIMQEVLHEDVISYGPSLAVPSSVWAVSVDTNEIRLLLNGAAYMQQNILRWLDDERFIAYEGSLLDPMYGALNLRLVDMDAGTSRMLFDDWFIMQRFDPVHETLAIVKQVTEKSPDGIYLASIKTGMLRRLEQPPYVMDFQWDPGTGLFVSSYECQDDTQSLIAFNYQGNFSCVPKPAPTPDPMNSAAIPAPNGIQNLSVKDGLWLETEGEPAIQVSPETVSDVVWCPDSNCVFFSVLQQDQRWTLYRVFLPDLSLQLVDEGIQSMGGYQWLGDEP